MADNRISLPSSGGGLLNYSQEHKSKIQIKPVYIIALIILFIIIELYLYKTAAPV